MAKKAAKVTLNPKAAKAQSDVEVTNEPQAKKEEPKISLLTVEGPEVDPISEEELNELIEEGQRRYQELTGKEPSVPLVVFFPELVSALKTLNSDNRYKKLPIVAQYTEAILSNRVDAQGFAIPGTSQWHTSLPMSVMLSESGVHNGQKCLQAYEDALSAFDENQKQAANKKEDEPFDDFAADRGLSRELLENIMTGTIIRDIDEDAVDKIDTAQPRKNPDLAFRRHLFDSYDYTGVFKLNAAKGESLESQVMRRDAALSKMYQEQSELYSTCLGFVAKRIWDNEHKPLPRQKSSFIGSAFTSDQFVEASAYFNKLADSVNHVWRLVVKQPAKQSSKSRAREMGLSPQYLATAHYLASMHDAVWNDDEGWQQTEEGRSLADHFINLLLSPQKEEGKVKKESGLLPWMIDFQNALKAWNGYKKADDVNDSIFNALGAFWRQLQFGKEDRYVKAFKNAKAVIPVPNTEVASDWPIFTYTEDDEDESAFDQEAGLVTKLAIEEAKAIEAEKKAIEAKQAKPKTPPKINVGKKSA